MDNLFSTHPSTENRIAALSQLAREMGPQRPCRFAAAARADGAVEPPPGQRAVGPPARVSRFRQR
jgi:heat shock protein HtpX